MTVGCLGGGQLGRMLALAGAQLGQRFVFLDPGRGACAGQVGELVVGAYDGVDELSELSRRADVVTYEFESVPVSAARYLASRVPVYPPPRALEVAQDRLDEKRFFDALGVPTAAFRPASTRDELRDAARALGLPVVVKTRRFGYDGKGQAVCRTEADVEAAFDALGAAPLLVERLVPFDFEVSLLSVRSTKGEVRHYPLVRNRHAHGILQVSVPWRDAALQAEGEAHAARVLAELDYVGVLCVEFFVVGATLVANELAPRVHNSGHFTVEGAETSQFENHVRAVLGLPLGSTRVPRPTAMVNVVGGAPNTGALLALDGAHVHLYGKLGAAPGRKLGHVTVVAETDDARDRLVDAVLAHAPFVVRAD